MPFSAKKGLSSSYKKNLITYNEFFKLLYYLISGSGNYAGFFNYIKNPNVINIMVGIISKIDVNKPPAFNLAKLLINFNENAKEVNVETIKIIWQ